MLTPPFPSQGHTAKPSHREEQNFQKRTTDHMSLSNHLAQLSIGKEQPLMMREMKTDLTQKTSDTPPPLKCKDFGHRQKPRKTHKRKDFDSQECKWNMQMKVQVKHARRKRKIPETKMACSMQTQMAAFWGCILPTCLRQLQLRLAPREGSTLP